MIKRYSLEEKIGKGNFGEVYSGLLKVAIKRIPKTIIEQQNIYEELEREKEILSKCQSNNIIKLFDFIETENYYDLILEKCDTDLNSILEKKHRGFTMIEIRNIMNQLNNGFKIMQLHNIIHRDIKLENIFVKYNNQSKNDFIVKLGDFGLSREFPNEKIDDSFCGSPETMAPEIYDEKPYNNKVDLYSIGMIMYQMYYNHFPNFNDDGIPIKLPSDVNFKDILIQLLKKNPDERISWNNYFNHDFFLDMKHVNILVIGKKKTGKSTLINNILKENIINSNIPFSNCNISEVKKERFRFFEMKGFNNKRYKFDDLIKDVDNLINNQISKKDPDKYIHCIWYCFNHDTFNEEEFKYINDLKENYKGEKIPVCFISTFTKDKKEVAKIFNKLNEDDNNENYVKCRLLAEPINIYDDEGNIIDIIKSYGTDYLIKRTISKLKDITQKKKINYLPFTSDRNKHRTSFTCILDQIQTLYTK